MRKINKLFLDNFSYFIFLIRVFCLILLLINSIFIYFKILIYLKFEKSSNLILISFYSSKIKI